MQVSIRAGFRSGELPRALGLAPPWQILTPRTLFGACRLIASR
jgi:hypothetical protein